MFELEEGDCMLQFFYYMYDFDLIYWTVVDFLFFVYFEQKEHFCSL